MNTVSTMTRKPFFWSLITGLAIVSAAFTYKYFTSSNPLITLDITMNREQALDKAHDLALKNCWNPGDCKTAVMFANDTLFQFFVELEGGGKDQFITILKAKIFQPYTWHVRQFKEKTTEETHVFFTPDGVPYRFIQKLAETTVKENLSVDEARTLAQETALHDWNIDFTVYKEIEASKDEKPCGRLDQTFVYERTDEKIGTEGSYRLKLVVSGDTVTEVNPFAFIPETFKRRYNEMRSSNETISTIGTVGFMVLYLLIGCLIGGFYFFKKHLLIIKPAALWAFGISILGFLASLNHLPFLWMNYDTATTTFSFLSQYFVSIFLMLLASTAFLTIIFSAVLTWDRLAFPHRVNFWKLWSPAPGGSVSVLGQTVGGYAYAVVFLGMATGIYLFLIKILGWWSPADTLTDPNILATYVPWLGAFAASLQAGFMEEVVFRALPLASAVIIGRYYKKERLFLFIGFILQAVIFAACHANYPQQPGYFRLVELLIPSWFFGASYILFGLLPGILAHFLYDLFLMTLPILISQASYAWVHKGIIALLALCPLLIVLYRRYTQPNWTTPLPSDYNSATTSLAMQQPKDVTLDNSLQKNSTESFAFSPKKQRLFYLAGASGLALFIGCMQFKSDTPALNVTKEQAIGRAQEQFNQDVLETDPGMDWKVLTFVTSLPSDQEKFIWQTQGKEKYQSLLGSYLTPPSWAVRYVSFTGDLIARAQEFTAVIGPDGALIRSNHVLPESKPGESIVQGQARGIALQAVEQAYGLTTQDIKEICAVAQDRPARKDWTFTFQDTTTQIENEGQARIRVTIAGNKIMNIHRFVFVPEQWTRDEQGKAVYRNLLILFVTLSYLFLVILSCIVLQKRLTTNFNLKRFGWFSLVLVPLIGLLQLNNLPQVIATSFTTMKPYVSQLFVSMTMPLIISAITGLILAALLTSIHTCIISVVNLSNRTIALLSICMCFCVEGISALIVFCSARYMPYVPNYLPINEYSSFYGTVIPSLQALIGTGSIFILIVTTACLYAGDVPKRKFIELSMIFLFGVCHGFNGEMFMSTGILCGLAYGIIFTVAYISLFKRDQTALIMFVTARVVLGILIRGVAQSYPGALVESILASIIIATIGYWWFSSLRKGKS